METAILFRRVLYFLALTAAPQPLVAQYVRGVVVDSAGTPLNGVVVFLIDSVSTVAARSLSDERGEFSMRLVERGTFRLRAMRIGYTPVTSEALSSSLVVERRHRLVLSGIAFSLAGLRVEARSPCRVARDSANAIALFSAWGQARTALSALDLTGAERGLGATTVVYERVLDPTFRSVLRQSSTIRSDFVTRPWRSLPPDTLRRSGYVSTDRDGATTYHAPGLDALLSNGFLEDHCVRLDPASNGDRLGIAFEPTPERRGRRAVAEIRGTVWLDRTSSELRSLSFRYVNVSRELEEHAGGEMEFVRMRSGGWAISRWSIRMPALESVPPSRNVIGEPVLRVAEINVVGGELALATRAGGRDTIWSQAPLVLEGIVRDSTSGSPAGDARVELSGTGLRAKTDASGRFSIRNVLPGQYSLEIRTASLDSVGAVYRLPLSFTSINTSIEARVPTAAQIAAATCKRETVDFPGIVIGTAMLRGDTVPPRNAKVIGEWSQPSIRTEGAATVVDRQSRCIEAAVSQTGTFRLCGVPLNMPLTLRAETSGAVATPVQVNVPATGRFARVELVLDRAIPAGALFTGTVLEASTRRPIADVTISIADGALTRITNDLGAFRIEGIPAGPQRLLVRRLGYGPLDTTIVFVKNRTIDRQIALTRVTALNSVRIEATSPELRSFEEHRRLGLGRFLTREELTAQQGRATAEVLAQVPGLAVARGSGSRAWILSTRPPPSLSDRGVYKPEQFERQQGMKAGCYARVYVDGSLMNPGQPAEPFNINSISPDRIEAIEYYAGPSQTPLLYNKLDSVCGVLVIWTRRS